MPYSPVVANLQPSVPQNPIEEPFLWRNAEIPSDYSNVGGISASGRKYLKRVGRTIPVLCATVVVNQDPFPSGSPTTSFKEIRIFSSVHCILPPPSTYRRTSMDGSAPSFLARAEQILSRFPSLIPGGKLGLGSAKGGRLLTYIYRQLVGVARGR